MLFTRGVIFGVLITICQSELHFLKFINSGVSGTNVPAQFNSTLLRNETTNIGNRMTKASRICVDGMWALYNTTNFGEGFEDQTTVISVRGRSLSVCTDEGAIPVLKQVQSIYYLGASNYNDSGIIIYSSPYLLGAMWSVTIASDGNAAPLPSTITGFPLGSIAITGNSAWLICEDSSCTFAVCVNLSNFARLFLQRNTASDSTVPGGWPKLVRSVRMISKDECANYPNPPPPKQARKIFKRDTTGGNAIEVYVQHM